MEGEETKSDATRGQRTKGGSNFSDCKQCASFKAEFQSKHLREISASHPTTTTAVHQPGNLSSTAPSRRLAMTIAKAQKDAIETVVKTLTEMTAKNGKRQLAEMFMELPDRETWAEYYEVRTPTVRPGGLTLRKERDRSFHTRCVSTTYSTKRRRTGTRTRIRRIMTSSLSSLTRSTTTKRAAR